METDFAPSEYRDGTPAHSALSDADGRSGAWDDSGAAGRPKTLGYTCRRWDGQAWQDDQDSLVEEMPISLVINGDIYALMMASPYDLEDFALGFLWTEAVLRSLKEVQALETEASSEGVAIYLQLDPDAGARAAAQRRHLPGASACGLCGRPDFTGLQPFPALPSATRPPDLRCIGDTMRELIARQQAHRENGSTHAAALRLRSHGILVREDIGRHNAVDKVIGAALRRGEKPGSAELLAVSSRLPFEIVRKALAWQIPAIAAMSGISSMALRVARDHHVHLAGFVRNGRCTRYCRVGRFAEHWEHGEDDFS